MYVLMCLQETEAHSGGPTDQDWLDHLTHILQQKVSLLRLSTDYSFQLTFRFLEQLLHQI